MYGYKTSIFMLDHLQVEFVRKAGVMNVTVAIFVNSAMDVGFARKRWACGVTCCEKMPPPCPSPKKTKGCGLMNVCVPFEKIPPTKIKAYYLKRDHLKKKIHLQTINFRVAEGFNLEISTLNPETNSSPLLQMFHFLLKWSLFRGLASRKLTWQTGKASNFQ